MNENKSMATLHHSMEIDIYIFDGCNIQIEIPCSITLDQAGPFVVVYV